MNHIARVTEQRDAAHAAIAAAQDELQDLLAYLSSDKFHGLDADHVHIRTDLMPRLLRLRAAML